MGGQSCHIFIQLQQLFEWICGKYLCSLQKIPVNPVYPKLGKSICKK